MAINCISSGNILLARGAPVDYEKSTIPLMQKLRNVGNHLSSFFVATGTINPHNPNTIHPRQSYASQAFRAAFRSAKTWVRHAYETIAVKLGGASKPLYEGAPSALERKAQGVAHAPQLHSTPETRQAAFLEKVVREVRIPSRDACYRAGDKIGAKAMDSIIKEELIERDRLLLPNAGDNRAALLYPGAPSAELKMAQAITRAPLVCFSQASKDVASLDKQINALIIKRDAAYTAGNAVRAMYWDMCIKPLHLHRDALASDM